MNAAEFKRRLRAREPVGLFNVDHVSCSLLDFAARLAPVDAVMFDCEQGTPSFEDVENLARTARLHEVASLVRIPSPEPWTIERHLMRGVDGLVVPRLNYAAQVAQAVRDMRYAVPREFEHKLVIVQVESVEALAELDDFLAIDEVDCWFIGAVDLAKSMGFDGDYARPEVLAELTRTVKHIRAAGRSVGFLVKEHDLGLWAEKGVTMFYAHFNDLLCLGARHWPAAACAAAPARP